MNRITSAIYAIFGLIMLAFVSCEKDDDQNKLDDEFKYEGLETPYLICANRNPGGTGFDFEYDGEKAGGFNVDDSAASANLEYDIIIRTIKGEKGDGSLGGAPFVQLHENVQAVNYSLIDVTCVGLTKFNELNASNVKDYTLASDNVTFDISSVKTGDTGAPMMTPLLEEYMKLVIGQRWKKSANNEVTDDEIIWLVETNEGRLVKLIVTDFPADPAAYPNHSPVVTETGFVDITWDFLN